MLAEKQPLLALGREIPRIVDERVRAVLNGRDTDQVGGLAKLAEWVGAPTPEAMRKRLERDRDLNKLAIRTSGGQRRWRRSEVLGLLTSRRTARE